MKRRFLSAILTLAIVLCLAPSVGAAKSGIEYYSHCTMIPDLGKYVGVEPFNEINLEPQMNTYFCTYYYTMSDIAMEEIMDYIDVLKNLGFKDYDPVLDLPNTLFSGKNAQGDEVEVRFVESGYWTVEVRHPVEYTKGVLWAEPSDEEPVTSSAATQTTGFSNFVASNAYTEEQFSDVLYTDWFADSVQSAYELGLMKGQSSDRFGVSAQLTFAETIALAARLHSIYNGNGDNFVQGSPWYQVYADYAFAHGIIDSAPADYGKIIYRGDFAYILANALPGEALEAVNSVEDGAIPDVPSGSYISEAVYKLYRAGVLTGNDSVGTFAPDSYIDRASVAAIITRMAAPSQRKSITLKKAQVVLYAPDARVISVPKADVQDYTNMGWSTSPSQWTVTESGNVKGVLWERNGGYLYAGGSGELTSMVLGNDADVHTLYLKQGITKIGRWACFQEYALRRVELSDTVTSIDSSAFKYCQLNRIGIPASVTNISSDAFRETIYWSDSNTHNPNVVFYCPAGSAAEKYAIKNEIPCVTASMVYYPDGRTCMVSEEERPIYLANGWYATPAEVTNMATMYALDGRTQQVNANDLSANQAVGWYLYADYICAKADQMAQTDGFNEAVSYLDNYMREEMKKVRGVLYNYDDAITRDTIAASLDGLKYFEKREALCAEWSRAINSPIAIVDSSIGHNSIGTPEVYITFRNLTGKDISALEVKFTCVDAYGNPTTDWPALYNSSFTGYMEDEILDAYSTDTYCWTLYNHERTASIQNPRILRAAATDGTKW